MSMDSGRDDDVFDCSTLVIFRIVRDEHEEIHEKIGGFSGEKPAPRWHRRRGVEGGVRRGILQIWVGRDADTRRYPIALR